MTAKEYLSQAFHIDQRISSKLSQVMRLREAATNCTATLTDMPRPDSPSRQQMADTICKIVDLEREINEDIDRLVSQLFLYSKLDLEGASMDLRPIRLDEFIIGFAEEAAPNSRARGLEITAEQRAAREIRVGGVRLNPETRRVFVDGREVSLKSRVYELLQFLMLHTEIVFSREELYEKIWGLEAMGDNATVAVHINRVREKIEQDPGHPRYIQTVWGAGYRFKGQ